MCFFSWNACSHVATYNNYDIANVEVFSDMRCSVLKCSVTWAYIARRTTWRQTDKYIPRSLACGDRGQPAGLSELQSFTEVVVNTHIMQVKY